MTKTIKTLAKEVADDPNKVEERHREWKDQTQFELKKLSKTLHLHLSRWYGSPVYPDVIRRMSWTYVTHFGGKLPISFVQMGIPIPLGKFTQDCYYYTHLIYAILLSLKIRNITLVNECTSPCPPLCALSQDEDGRLENKLALYRFLVSLLPSLGEELTKSKETVEKKANEPTNVEKRLKTLEDDVKWIKKALASKKQHN